MSRYIDADKLLTALPDDLPYKASVKRVLTLAPTANVAPIADTVKRMQVLLHKKANYKVCGYYCVSTDDIDEIAKKVIGGAE